VEWRTVAHMTPHTGSFLAAAAAVLERADGLDLPSLNESNTKRLLIEPVLSALGWDLYSVNSVTSEYPVYSGIFLDYALLVNSKAVLFCEAKPSGKRLEDPKWVSQTVNYANNEGVIWCVLTDGIRWRVFKANEALPMERKLAFEVYLTDLRTDVKRDHTLRLFQCLTPGAVADGELTRLGNQVFIDGRVREALIGSLEQPDKKLVDLLRGRIGDSAPLSPADIKAALTRVAAHAITVLSKDSDAGPTLDSPPRLVPTALYQPIAAPSGPAAAVSGTPSTPPEPIVLVRSAEQVRDRASRRQSPTGGTEWSGVPDILAGHSASTVQLARIASLRAISGYQARSQLCAVVKAGLLTAGETLTFRHHKQDYTSTLRADGWVDVPGHPSPLALSSAISVAAGGGSWNGWDHWTVDRDGARVKLTALRRQLANG
jgi:hypothetical protein